MQPSSCVLKKWSKKHRYCSSLRLWFRVTQHLAISSLTCRIRRVVTWTTSSTWSTLIQPNWKNVRKSTLHVPASTRTSRSTCWILMQLLVRKQALVQAPFLLRYKDIMEVCMHPTSTVLVRCIVSWYRQNPTQPRTWSHCKVSRCATAMRWLLLPSLFLSRKFTVRMLSADSTCILLWKSW